MPLAARSLVFEAADNTAGRPIAAVLVAAADLIKARWPHPLWFDPAARNGSPARSGQVQVASAGAAGSEPIKKMPQATPDNRPSRGANPNGRSREEMKV
jgi:hypothetical protein